MHTISVDEIKLRAIIDWNFSHAHTSNITAQMSGDAKSVRWVFKYDVCPLTSNKMYARTQKYMLSD